MNNVRCQYFPLKPPQKVDTATDCKCQANYYVVRYLLSYPCKAKRRWWYYMGLVLFAF